MKIPVLLLTLVLFSSGCKTKEILPERSVAGSEMPTALGRMKDVHPRMYLTAGSLKQLKSKITAGHYSVMLNKLKTIADRAVQKGAPAYRPGSGYDEQLWQREVGNAIPELSMAYLLTGQKKYLDSARDYMLASASYPTWGIGDIDNKDLATGHQLYGIALGYDWLYHDLDKISRDSIRNCLLKRGGKLYELLRAGKVWWHNAYLHNHQHVSLAGLAAAGLALYGEGEVDGWIQLPLQKFRQVVATHPPDGGWHEGIPYSGYGIEYTMKFMDLAKGLLDEDLFRGSSFFHNLSGFRLYAMIPQEYWNASKSTLMTVGDSPRTDWYGPDYILRKVAKEYNDGYAQWLADKLDSAGFSSPQAYFLNFLWYEPALKPVSPINLPHSRHFNDLDIAYLRSGWNGKESLSMFKCGPHIGHYAVSQYTYDPYGGHTHPDVGTLLIFSHGDWLLADEGYAWKRTVYQNTLVINGKGQHGEGRWFSGKNYIGAKELPRIIYNNSSNGYHYIIGDAKPAYPASTHLTQFYRHILYMKPDCWIIADEVKADSVSRFDFYYHSNFPFSSDGNGSFNAGGTRGSMKLTTLKPTDASNEAFIQDIDATGGGIAGRINALKISSVNRKTELFVTVIESYSTGQQPAVNPQVISEGSVEYLVLRINGTEKKFRIDSDRADKKSPLFTEIK